MARQKLADLAKYPSEGMLSEIWDITDIAMGVADSRGSLVKVNRAYEKFYGWSEIKQIDPQITLIRGQEKIEGFGRIEQKNGAMSDVYFTASPLVTKDSHRY